MELNDLDHSIGVIDLSVFPNPTKGKIHFKTEQNEPIKKIIVYNQMGTRMKNYVVNSLTFETDFDLPAGICFVELQFERGAQIEKVMVLK